MPSLRAILRCLLVTALGVACAQAAMAQDASEDLESRAESHRLFWTAHEAREAGDLLAATGAVDRALELDPGSAETWYLAGHVAYDLEDPERAAACFAEVAALDPGGPLGVAAAEHLAQLAWQGTRNRARDAIARGDRETASEALAALAEGAPPDVAADARDALGALEAHQLRRVGWGASAGLAVDTNPLYVSESARDGDAQTGAGSTLDLWGAVPVFDHRGIRAVVAVSTLARTYVAGPAGSDFARIRATLEVSADLGPTTAWLGADAALALLGWRPLLDLERLQLGARWDAPPEAHGLEARLEALRRGAHLDGYDNLTARGWRAEAAWVWSPGPALELDLAWSLVSEAATPYEVAWTVPEDQGGGTHTVVADASFVGHGPGLRLGLRSPWRSAEVDLGARVQRRGYARAERVAVDRGGSTASETGERQDVRWTAELTASMELRPALRALVSVSAVHNASSLDGQEWAIDRSFGRTLWVAGLEVRP